MARCAGVRLLLLLVAAASCTVAVEHSAVTVDLCVVGCVAVVGCVSCVYCSYSSQLCLQKGGAPTLTVFCCQWPCCVFQSRCLRPCAPANPHQRMDIGCTCNGHSVCTASGVRCVVQIRVLCTVCVQGWGLVEIVATARHWCYS